MSTEIYYFSGTGNSLHVAQELRQRIPDARLIPMAGLLHRSRSLQLAGETVETAADTAGFVFPIHLMAIPAAVREFLEHLEPRSADYIFSPS
jgi:flavodoxin